jgi:hypothetical protein
MSERGESDAEPTTVKKPIDVGEPIKSAPESDPRSEPVTSEPATSEPATSEPVTSEPVTSTPASVPDASWDEVTPPRQPLPSNPWSASEVTTVTSPLVPESEEPAQPLLPPILSDPEVHGETSGTLTVPQPRAHNPLPSFRSTPHVYEATRTGIELGRPVYAVAVIGVMSSFGALLFAGTAAAVGVAVGASVATLNLWAFTRIGTVFLSRRGLRTSWGLLAIFKLVGLFAAVGLVLKMEVADPISFLIGYLALPVGIVASQLLGLQADYEEP